MKKYSESEENKTETYKINNNPHTKYSKYILDNYFVISFKVALWIAAKPFWKLYLDLKGRWLDNSKKVAQSRKPNQG